MNEIAKLEQLFLAVRSLRKADNHSKRMCAEFGKSPTDYVRRHWTNAAVERDRCYEYARRLAADYFGLADKPEPRKEDANRVRP